MSYLKKDRLEVGMTTYSIYSRSRIYKLKCLVKK